MAKKTAKKVAKKDATKAKSPKAAASGKGKGSAKGTGAGKKRTLASISARLALNKFLPGGGRNGNNVWNYVELQASEAFFSTPAARNRLRQTSSENQVGRWELQPRTTLNGGETLIIRVRRLAPPLDVSGGGDANPGSGFLDDTLELDITVTNGSGATAPTTITAPAIEEDPQAP